MDNISTEMFHVEHWGFAGVRREFLRMGKNEGAFHRVFHVEHLMHL